MAGRPTEYEDLARTTLCIERSLLNEAKEAGINVSDVARNALRTRLKRQERRVDPLKKFRDLPSHLVRDMRRMKENGQSRRLVEEIGWVNRAHGRDITMSDVEALVPRF